MRNVLRSRANFDLRGNISVHLSVYLSMALQPFAGPWPLFQFHDLIQSRRTPLAGNRPVAKPLTAHRTAQTQNKRTQTSIPWVGFEPTTPVLERAKTVYVLDRATTVSAFLYIQKLNAIPNHTHTYVKLHVSNLIKMFLPNRILSIMCETCASKSRHCWITRVKFNGERTNFF
jgi:hypothetical protein